MSAPKGPRAGGDRQRGDSNDLPIQVSTPARVRWTPAQLREAKLEQQHAIDRLSNLGRALSPRERGALLVHLRAVRQITKFLAQRRAVLPRRGRP